MSILPDIFIKYVTEDEVVGDLNLTFDEANKRYTLYNVKILPLTVTNSVNYANVFVNSVVGDATSNSKQFARAKILAREMAALRVAVVSAGGWVKGASNYSFSGLYVGVGTAATEALQQLAATKKTEIDTMLMMVQGQTTVEEVDQSLRDFYAQRKADFIA